MKTAIEIAWNENLQLEEDCQYKTKEEIIKDRCPLYNIFEDVDLELPSYCMGDYDKEYCNACWNRDIESNKKIYKSKLPESIHKKIVKSDNERIQEYFDEFIQNEIGKKHIEGAYYFLQFILKHE